MKKQLLTTASLILAGTSILPAANNLTDRLGATDAGTYHYTDENTWFKPSLVGSNPYSEVDNYSWGSTQLNLGQDARWVITFTIDTNNGQAHGQPLFNAYLAAPNNSIVYGNYYLYSGRGAAAIQHFNGTNVAEGDKNVSANSYVLSDYLNGHAGGTPKLVDGIDKGTVHAGGNLANGTHRYTIIVESFSDHSKDDLIMFTYDNLGDNASPSQSGVFSIDNNFGGIAHDRNLTVGCFVDDCLGSVSLTNVTFEKEARQFVAATPPTPPPEPQPEPAPTPSVPEPSAFGLLAGIGALALVASRRRRK